MSRNYSLSRIDYDSARHIVTDVTPYVGETPDTIFFNGIIAIVRSDAPALIPFLDLQSYLADVACDDTALRFYTLSHTQTVPPVTI